MVEDTVALTSGTVIHSPELCNLYGCVIGDSEIGPFVEIQSGAVVGSDTKICSHAFICGGAIIGDRCFIGHSVVFCNDLFPVRGGPVFLSSPIIEDDVSIGSGAVILPGVRVGQGSIVGAGSVVIRDVPAWSVVVGNPAHIIRFFQGSEDKAEYLKHNAQRLHSHATS